MSQRIFTFLSLFLVTSLMLACSPSSSTPEADSSNTPEADSSIIESESKTLNVIKSEELMTKACYDALELDTQYDWLLPGANLKPIDDVIILIKNASAADPSNKEFFTLSLTILEYSVIREMSIEYIEADDELKAIELINTWTNSWRNLINYCEDWILRSDEVE